MYVCMFLCMHILMFSVCKHHSWKKVGILATGCRPYEDKVELLEEEKDVVEEKEKVVEEELVEGKEED